jgi:hypothetical protein
MNVEKALIKVSAVHDVGVRLDDALDIARADVLRTEGAAHALERASDAMAPLLKLVDKDLDEQKIADIATATAIKKWLERSATLLKDLRQQYQQGRVQAQGRAAGFEGAVAIAKKFVDDERKKIEGFQRAVEDGRAGGEGSQGSQGRPPPSIKAQRTASGVTATTTPSAPAAPKKKKGKSDGKNTR